MLQGLLTEAQLPLLQLLLKSSNPGLQVIDLSHSYLTSKVAADILKLFTKNSRIRQLRLGSTNLHQKTLQL